METLSKIGEYFFEDGRVSEEERLRVYREYKAKMRIQKQVANKKQAVATKANANAKPKTTTAANVSKKGKGSDTKRTKASKNTGVSSRARQSATTNTNSNTNNTRTTSRTTGDEYTSESAEEDSPSESSSTDDLESMIPETVCADLSVRSVSTKSVISESGTDSGSHRDHHSVEESLQSLEESTRRSTSRSRSRSRSGSTGTGRSIGTGTRSRTMSVSIRERDDEDDEDDDDEDEEDSETSEHDKQRQHQPPRGPVKKDRNRSAFSLHRIISPFTGRLGTARSASVTLDTLRQDETETVTLFDDQGTVERQMVEQLLQFINTGDLHDDDDEDSVGSHSSASSQESLTHISSIPNDPPPPQAATAVANLLGRKQSKGASTATTAVARKQSATKASTKNSDDTNDVYTEEFEAGLDTVSSTGVFSNNAKSVNTMTSANPRAIHGWVEDDTQAEGPGLGNRIELAISADTKNNGNDGHTKSDSDPHASSVAMSAKEMEALDSGFQAVAPTFSVDVPDTKINLFGLSKLYTSSNVVEGEDGIQGFKNVLAQARIPKTQDEQKPPRPPQTALNGPSQKRASSRLFGQFFSGKDSKVARKTAPPRADTTRASKTANNNSRNRSLPIPQSMETAIEKARSTQMEAAIEKVKSAQMYTPPSGPHQLLDIMQKHSHDRASKDPSSSQPNNTQDNRILQKGSHEHPPKRPSPPPPNRQESGVSVMKGITVTTTCSGSMDGAEASNMQEYIEVTYDLAASTEDEESSSKEQISSSVASPRNDGEEQESMVEKVHKDVEGVYTKGIQHKQVQAVIPTPTRKQEKKQKTSFMKRLLSSRKKSKKNKADISDNSDNNDNPDAPNEDQTRHIIGTTSVFSDCSPNQKTEMEETHSLGDLIEKGAQERSALESPPSMQPPSTDLPAPNGFMQAMENLKLGPDDFHLPAPAPAPAPALSDEQADKGDQEDDQEGDLEGDQEDNSEHVRFAPNDAVEHLVRNEDEHSVEEHQELPIPASYADESPIKRLLRTISRTKDKDKGSEHNFAASPGPTGVEIISQVGKRPPRKKNWVRSISLPTRTKRDKELATDEMRDREDAGMMPLPSNGTRVWEDIGVTPLPPTLPKATRTRSKVVESTAREQSVESIYDVPFEEEEEDDDDAFAEDVNPWCSIHPNYAFRQHANVPPVDGADENQSQRRKARAKLVKALAKRLLEERQLENVPDDMSEDLYVIDHPEFEEYAGVGFIKDSRGKPKKKGLGKLKSSVGRLFKGKKTRRTPLHPTNSLEDLRDQSVGATIEQQYDDVGPIIPSEQGTDNIFLMQHQMLLQSRNPTWKQPMPKGGSGSFDRTFPGFESTTVDYTYATLENETQQAKLLRVLGRREEQKRAKHLDNSILDVHPNPTDRNMKKLLKTVSASSSSIEDTLNGGDSTTYAYSIQNQRVLKTLKLLHAVKKRKKIEERRRSGRMQDCSDFMDPLIDGIEEAACGGGQYQAKLDG